MPSQMRIRKAKLLFATTLLSASIGCSRSQNAELVIHLPPNFKGEVQVQMGINGAPALKREGGRYVVDVPIEGKVITSTILPDLRPKVENVDPKQLWGYIHSTTKTGDQIPIEGHIEFFVGTKNEYETEEAKKHKSMIRYFSPLKA